jgi:hypothetical protein
MCVEFKSAVNTILKPALAVPATTKLQIVNENTNIESSAKDAISTVRLSPWTILLTSPATSEAFTISTTYY